MSKTNPASQTPTRDFSQIKRLVVKIGSSLLTDNGKGLHYDAFAGWAEQLAALHKQGIEIILVSSGAIAEGVVRMKLEHRPKLLPQLQACAAIGQMGLVQAWSSEFLKHDIQTSQVLLTHDDLTNRERYLNAGGALAQMLDWGVIPVINENDTIVIDEIRFGDNDTLGAMAAALVSADLYVILTDQHGIYDDNPSTNPDAKLIHHARAMDDSLFDVAGEGGKLGSGGMLTKVKAGRLAAKAGCPTIIAHGSTENIISRLLANEMLGTLLTSDNDRVSARKQWLAAHLQMAGRLILDDGAVNAIRQNQKSLLPIGVTKVEGSFSAGDVVECVNEQGERVAVGRVNFDAVDAEKIAREPTDKLETILGHDAPMVMIHRDDMTIM